jgi:hypothetical protein
LRDGGGEWKRAPYHVTHKDPLRGHVEREKPVSEPAFGFIEVDVVLLQFGLNLIARRPSLARAERDF